MQADSGSLGHTLKLGRCTLPPYVPRTDFRTELRADFTEQEWQIAGSERVSCETSRSSRVSIAFLSVILRLFDFAQLLCRIAQNACFHVQSPLLEAADNRLSDSWLHDSCSCPAAIWCIISKSQKGWDRPKRRWHQRRLSRISSTALDAGSHDQQTG